MVKETLWEEIRSIRGSGEVKQESKACARCLTDDEATRRVAGFCPLVLGVGEGDE